MRDTDDTILNPSFLCLSAGRNALFACCEHPSAGKLVSYRIIDGGRIDFLSETEVIPGGFCHLCLSEGEKWLFGANYRKGGVFWVHVDEDGCLSRGCQAILQTGTGPHPRQDSAHTHQCLFSGNELYVPCLGLDKILRYKFEESSGALVPDTRQPYIACKSMDGPRHLAFDKAKERLYAINELSNSIIYFGRRNDVFVEEQRVSLLPKRCRAEPGGAEVLLSPDKRFLVASMRFFDCIVTYNIDAQTGKLSRRKIYNCHGKQPRMISLTPDGHFLLTANYGSGNIAVCRFDCDTGAVSDCVFSMEVPCASFVQAVAVEPDCLPRL